MTDPSPCELCNHSGGSLLHQTPLLRIVRVADPRFPAYFRVILNRHVREMTDLPKAEQLQVLGAVLACERVLRRTVPSHKINLASLGNLTPHVHWHIIVRHPEDSHFPDAIWAPAKRSQVQFDDLPADAQLSELLQEELQT